MTPLLRRGALILSALLVVVLVAASALTVLLIRRPLPDHSGIAEIDGLDAEVQVLRDERGVPQIFAGSDDDLFRAQGYVHAQDRFFEMDYRRHVASGRLSELVGVSQAAQEADAVIRTLGWRQVAEQEWQMLDPATRGYFEAYAEGVNAYLRDREASELSVEYTVLGAMTTLADIEPWDPVDSLTWLKAMAWDLRSNYDAELGRAAALRPLAGDVARVEELYPGYPYSQHPPVLTPQEDGAGDGSGADAGPGDVPGGVDAGPAAASGGVDAGPAAAPGARDVREHGPTGPGWLDRAATNALASAHEAIQAVPVLLGEGEGVGSNSFVVAGEHTASGAPLLANDPHLSISAPGVWYQVGLHCTEASAECTFDVAGFSFAGMPGVIIGHNSELSWGLTNLRADVTDFFLERVYEDGTHLYDGERVDLSRRTETIEVNGGSDIALTITSTRHGPIISDVLPETSAAGSVPVPQGSPSSGFSGYAVALGWTALQPGRTAEAIFAMNRATDAEELAAAAAILDVPAQNIVFATTDGVIGYQAPGRVPVRRPVPEGPLPSDGSWPRPGWDPRYDWQGFIPPEEMPAAVNPEEGFIVAANQAVTPRGEGPFFTEDWAYGYRADRIRTLLEASIADGPLDTGTMNTIMLDDHSPYAPVLAPALLQVDVDDPFVQEAVDLLRQWSADGFPQSRDSAAAAYFAAVWANVLELTFSDELPASQAPDGGSRWLHVVRELLDDPENAWWDDRTTVDQVEGRDLILQRSLVRARRQLTNFLGKDADRWEWGKVHDAEFRHLVLGGESLPVPLTTLMNPAAVGVSGGSSIVNAMSWDAGARTRDGRPVFTVTTAPSMRMVSDLSDLDDSRWVNLTGSSGHAGSAHYTDQIDAWADGRTFPWPFSRAAVEEAATDELTLRPAD